MAAKYLTEGVTVPFTNSSGSTIDDGTVVVMGNRLGVTRGDIANGTTGVVQVCGVFSDVPKVSAAVIAAGESLVWDVSANSGAGAFDDNLATSATGDISGPPAVAYEAAGAGATTMKVYFTGVPGTKT